MDKFCFRIWAVHSCLTFKIDLPALSCKDADVLLKDQRSRQNLNTLKSERAHDRKTYQRSQRLKSDSKNVRLETK